MAVVHETSGFYPSYIVNGDMGGDILGDWIRMPGNARTLDFQLDWTGDNSPVGDFELQAADVPAPTGTEIITVAGSVAAGGGAGGGEVGVAAVKHKFYRLWYDRTSDGADALAQVRARVGVG